MPLEPLALTLALVHFGVPLAYYLYAKTVWLPKPWNLKLDEAYKPKVTIILPTYNEARIIADRLDNIYAQDYPRELTEVIVIDSASTDGTPEIVEEWAKRHSDLTLKLIREAVERGEFDFYAYVAGVTKAMLVARMSRGLFEVHNVESEDRIEEVDFSLSGYCIDHRLKDLKCSYKILKPLSTN